MFSDSIVPFGFGESLAVVGNRVINLILVKEAKIRPTATSLVLVIKTKGLLKLGLTSTKKRTRLSGEH